MVESRLYPERAIHGRVAHDIGRRIVSGEIAEGALLPREAELSAQFSVSRQAVREALKVLAAKGLVASRRRTGTHVLPRTSWNLLDPDVLAWHPVETLTEKFIHDLTELRKIIEPAAAELAAMRYEEPEIAEIRAAFDAMAASEDILSLLRADAEFHVAIFAASGNDLIERLSTVLRPLLNTGFRIHENVRVDPRTMAELHRPVLEAILKGDRARAREEMDHLLTMAAPADLQRAVARGS